MIRQNEVLAYLALFLPICLILLQNIALADPLGSRPYNPLEELVPAGGGRLRAGTESTMLQTGTESTTLQGGTEGALIQGGVERVGGPVTILILVDCSQSMKDKISSNYGGSEREQKMDAAKRVLQSTMARIPPDVRIGMRVFGQALSMNPNSDCQQSALLVPIGTGNRRSIIDQIRGIRPAGMTPLTYGLMQSEQDLRYVEGTKTLILISDGAETCGGDPCAYIEKLSRVGVKIKIDIVGLGLRGDREAKEQLNCIAEKSGGKFYDANTAAELVNSLSNSVKSAISGKVVTKIKAPISGQPSGAQAPGQPTSKEKDSAGDSSIIKDLPADFR